MSLLSIVPCFFFLDCSRFITVFCGVRPGSDLLVRSVGFVCFFVFLVRVV